MQAWGPEWQNFYKIISTKLYMKAPGVMYLLTVKGAEYLKKDNFKLKCVSTATSLL